MLHKRTVDKKLEYYIKKHLDKGHSKDAVGKVLVNHGYEESYVQRLLLKHSETQFVKGYALTALIVFMISTLSFNLLPAESRQKITGYALIQEEATVNYLMLILALLSVLVLVSLPILLKKRRRLNS